MSKLDKVSWILVVILAIALFLSLFYGKKIETIEIKTTDTIVVQKIDTIVAQLALSHCYGNGEEVSCRNTVDAVSSVLNGIEMERIYMGLLEGILVFAGAQLFRVAIGCVIKEKKIKSQGKAPEDYQYKSKELEKMEESEVQ